MEKIECLMKSQELNPKYRHISKKTELGWNWWYFSFRWLNQRTGKYTIKNIVSCPILLCCCYFWQPIVYTWFSAPTRVSRVFSGRLFLENLFILFFFKHNWNFVQCLDGIHQKIEMFRLNVITFLNIIETSSNVWMEFTIKLKCFG